MAKLICKRSIILASLKAYFKNMYKLILVYRIYFIFVSLSVFNKCSWRSLLKHTYTDALLVTVFYYYLISRPIIIYIATQLCSSAILTACCHLISGSIKISEEGTEGSHGEFVMPAESTTSSLVGNTESEAPTQYNGIKSPPSSTVLGSDMGNAADGSPSLPKISEETVELSDAISEIRESIQQSFTSRISSSTKPNFEKPFQSQVTQERSLIQEDDTRDQRLNKDALEKVRSVSNAGVMEDKEKMEEQRREQKQFIERNELLENEFNKFTDDDSTKKGNLNSTTLLNEKPHGKGRNQLTEKNELENELNNVSNDDSTKKGNLSSTTLLNEKPHWKGQKEFTEWNEPLENGLNKFSNDDSTKKGNLNSTTLLNEKPHGKGQRQFTERNEPLENELNNFSNDDSTEKENLNSTTILNEKPQYPRLVNDKIEDGSNVKFPLQSAENCEQISNQIHNQAEKINTMNDVYVGTACHEDINTNDSFLSNKTELKSEIEMLREELREAAALEVSMYSVIAEHGSSLNKVHAPARRLSRFYFHACRVGSHATIASAAQSVVSGFVLVSKACGNDVPRYTKLDFIIFLTINNIKCSEITEDLVL